MAGLEEKNSYCNPKAPATVPATSWSVTDSHSKDRTGGAPGGWLTGAMSAAERSNEGRPPPTPGMPGEAGALATRRQQAHPSLQGWQTLGKGGERVAKNLSWRSWTVWGWSWEEPELGLCS